jgi:DNA-binding NtrC family response regulator
LLGGYNLANRKISDPVEIKQFISDYAQSNYILEQWDLEHSERPRTTLKQALKDLEHSMITSAMEECNYNKTHAAAVLGISRNLLIHKLNKIQRINQQNSTKKNNNK